MTDRVPTKPGRVKLTKEDGTVEYAVLERADEPTQEGTPINKATLLSDATAAMLGGCSTPDGALAKLGRFNSGLGNEYLWHKLIEEPVIISVNNLGNIYSQFVSSQYGETSMTLYPSITLSENGEISLSGDPVIVKGHNNGDRPAVADYVGFYGITSVGKIGVITANSNVGGLSMNGYGFQFTGCDTLGVAIKRTSFGYVNSNDESAYPPAVPDGYTYDALGQLGHGVRIATGSYVGTGTYGVNNPCSLTFDFSPKLLAISGRRKVVNANEYQYPFAIILCGHSGLTVQPLSEDSNGSYIHPLISTMNETTVNWFSKKDAERQQNISDTTYSYLALG